MYLNDDATFDEWKAHHNFSFDTLEENIHREQNFLANQKLIIKNNLEFLAGKRTSTMGLNKFSGFDAVEWSNFLDSKKIALEFHCPENVKSPGSYPESWSSPDVTPIKDQGNCGSCYIFGATVAAEAAYCREGIRDCSEWEGLSEQQVLDCGHDDKLNPY